MKQLFGAMIVGIVTGFLLVVAHTLWEAANPQRAPQPTPRQPVVTPAPAAKPSRIVWTDKPQWTGVEGTNAIQIDMGLGTDGKLYWRKHPGENNEAATQ